MLSLTTNEAETIAIRALAATLTDERRAQRFLDLTGFDAADLRARAGEPATLAAVMAFLAAHEPDLVDVADAMGEPPETLVAAAGVLGA